MGSDEKRGSYGAHILAVPYPSQGHINPMLQFCKRLVSKGQKATIAITTFLSNSLKPVSDTVGIDTFSDGCDESGFAQAADADDYLNRLVVTGSKTLDELIQKYKNSGSPIDCVVYDSFLPWAAEVAKKYEGLYTASFFTQACSVTYVYYAVNHGMLPVPVTSTPVRLPGLLPLELPDMPSFIYQYGSRPAYFKLLMQQFLNLEKADFVLINSFLSLEAEVLEAMSKTTQFLTIGPTIPSFYLDNRVENDTDYGLNLFPLDPSTSCVDWLNTKPEGSVIYVSFGSMADLDEKQMEELAWGLKNSNIPFLWVVRRSEESKLPKGFIDGELVVGRGGADQAAASGLVVNWCPQLKVLANKAVGCFFTHGGWNSTIEALSIGVPMVVMPQWTDQTMNAKLVVDMWKVGRRVRVGEDGLVSREEVEGCVREVLDEVKGKEMKENAVEWSRLAKEALSEGGTSDQVIEQFLSALTTTS
ncbi:unnamed protein product [Cuscuta epithymum]|uniref:Glycosyltransferase n=1 Tax=Cuscuta epithymum TaxID=186058 RepID=A0AAV0FSQ2_9ASTE|nr:unnamed protein product [Cuscuta epithymum]